MYSDIKIPPYRYFPTNLMNKEGPRSWAMLRFLQACERLKIPTELWPHFPDLLLPHAYGGGYLSNEQHTLPMYNMLYESEFEWKQRARAEFEVLLDRQALEFRRWLQSELDGGRLTAIKTTRGATPINLRYEWAVRRYCLKEQYKVIASGRQYNAEQIRKAVDEILRLIRLKNPTDRK